MNMKKTAKSLYLLIPGNSITDSFESQTKKFGSCLNKITFGFLSPPSVQN